jgi:hypothetical protein
MAIDPENWLAVEQVMEDENHVLLQAGSTESDQPTQPQLLVISSHAVNGTSSAATFSLVVTIAGKRGVALVDSGSTYTFMDYSFASQLSCQVTTIATTRVRVVVGGSLNTSAVITDVQYVVQKEKIAATQKAMTSS